MRKPQGKVSLTAILAIAGIVGGVWWLVNYTQIWLDHMEVRDAVRGAINGFANRQPPSTIRHTLLLRVNGPNCGWHREDDGFGNLVVVKGLGLKDDNLVIERDDVARTVRIAIDYDREVTLKPQNKVKIVHFHYELSGPAPD